MSDTKIKTSNIGNLAVTHALLHTDMDLTSKTVQVAAPSSNTHPATKLYVDTEVANLIDSAPGTLDTLNELAAAINDDANFNATIASSIATKLPLSGGTLTGNLTLASTASGSSASPEFELRRDITGADANYIGQIKFTADNDADQNTVFAKITGKILDASDGTEDGIIEFAHKKAGSNNISARFRSDSLQLINGTNLTVAGTTDLTGNLTVDTNTLYVDTSNNRVGIGTSSPVRDIQIGDNTGSAAVVSLQTTTSGNGSIYFGDNTATSAEYAGMLRYSHSDNAMQFWTSSEERMRIQSDGAVVLKPNGITTGLRLQGRSSDNNFYIQWKSNDGNTTYGSIGTDSTNTSLLYNTDIHAFNSASSANNFLKLQSTGAVFNEGGADRDFRVESNNNDNMLFVDAGNDRISVGSGSTYSMFNVISSNDNTSDWWTNNVATQYIQNTVGHPVLKMNNNNSNRSAYLVYNGNGSAQGFHIFDRQNEQSRISAYTSSVVINEAGTDVDFRVESDSNTHMLFVDAGSNEVGIGTSDPRSPLHVQTSHSSTDVTAANTNSTLSIGNSATGNGVYNAIKFAANQQDMYIMSFNNTQVADRRLGFFLGSVAGDAVADERLSIRGNGNVGINKPGPSATLDIANNDVSQTTLNVSPPGSGDQPVSVIARGSGSHKGSGLRIAGANYTNGSNSNAAFLELSAGSYSGSGTKYIHAYDNSGTDFLVDGDGRVGIGTGSPSANFDVRVSRTDTDPLLGLFSQQSSGADARVMIGTVANQNGDPYLKFDAGGQNMIVGEFWKGSTNNELRIGRGERPSDSNFRGLRVDGGGQTFDESGVVGPMFYIQRNYANHSGSGASSGTWGTGHYYTDLTSDGDFFNLKDHTASGLQSWLHGDFSPSYQNSTWRQDIRNWGALRIIFVASRTGNSYSTTSVVFNYKRYFYSAGWTDASSSYDTTFTGTDSDRGRRWCVMPWIDYSDFSNGADVPGLGIVMKTSNGVDMRIGACYVQYRYKNASSGV